MSTAHWLSLRNAPNSVSSRKAATAPQASRASLGASPKSATVMPASTQTAGSCTMALPSSWPTALPTSPVFAPWMSPMPRPARTSRTTGPRIAKTRWLAAQVIRPTAPASTGSARWADSSLRSRSAACTA